MSYWFTPAPLLNLAIVRVLTVGFQLFWLVEHGLYTSVVGQAQKPEIFYQPLPVLRVMLLGTSYMPSVEVISLIFALTLAAGLLALIGFKTRPALGLFALGSLFITAFNYSFGDFHHPEAIVLISLVVLALSPCGQMLSVDSFEWGRRKAIQPNGFAPSHPTQETSEMARWPILLIQWTLVLIYLSAFISKIVRDDSLLHWLNGYTLRYYMLQDGLRWQSDLGVFLSQYHVLAVLLSIGTVVFEAAFVLLIFFPRLAWLFLPFGTVFHLSIYIIQRAPFFSFIVAYSVFVPWARAFDYLSTRLRKTEIFYDGQCPLCRQSMYTLNYFDWLERVTYRDLNSEWMRLAAQHPEITLDEARREMIVLRPDGKLEKGFFAFRYLWARIPVFMPFALIAHLPFAGIIGPRVYGFVAARRKVEHCSDEVCAIPNRGVAVGSTEPKGAS
jgi:predicted DCC family thiol-disulfide oxidoreductase YuxK